MTPDLKNDRAEFSTFDTKDSLKQFLISVDEIYNRERAKNPFKQAAFYATVFGAASFGVVFALAYFAAINIADFSMPIMGGIGLTPPNSNESNFAEAFEFAFILGISSAAATAIAFAARGVNAIQEQTDRLAALNARIELVSDMIGSLELDEAIAKKEKRESREMLAKAGQVEILYASVNLETQLDGFQRDAKTFNSACDKKLREFVNDSESALAEARKYVKEFNRSIEEERRSIESERQAVLNSLVLSSTEQIEEVKQGLEELAKRTAKGSEVITDATEEAAKSNDANDLANRIKKKDSEANPDKYLSRGSGEKGNERHGY